MIADVFSSGCIESSEVIQLFKRMITGFLAAFCLLLLILDTKTSIIGAAEGIDMCIRVLIPSLFPFFIISVLLTDLLASLSASILRPLGNLLRIPTGSEAFLLIGMLGGYPVGAQTICQAHEHGILRTKDAKRMLGFCSNVGPAFLFGVVAPQFPAPVYTWVLWEILIMSVLLTGLLLPGASTYPVSMQNKSAITLSQAMERSLKIIASVCGWAVIFRVILAFFERWFLWMAPKAVTIAINLMLELTNGCIMLDQIDNVCLRFVMCAAGLSFGGLCVTAQTRSVAGDLGTGMYLPGKLLQTGIIILLAVPIGFLMDCGIPRTVIAAILLGIMLIFMFVSFFRKNPKNKYGNILPASV